MKLDLKKVTIAVLLILLAVISFTKLAPWAANPDNHTHSIEQTEEKISTVMTLSGGAAATSATLSLLPGDMCTPLAQQLAELAKYFLLVLSSLYLEKFMICITGYIAFAALIPIACVILAASELFGYDSWKKISGKIAIFAIILFLIVPASVQLSDMVYQTQADRVNNAVEEYNSLDIEKQEGDGIISELSTITNTTIEKITSFIGGLLEALAVMLVTACIIPVLVFVFLVWLGKTVFNSNVMTLDTSSVEKLLGKFKESGKSESGK